MKKRQGTFWGGPGPSKIEVTTEQMVKSVADDFAKSTVGNLQAAFMFSWAVTKELERRFRESPEQEALKGKEKERCQKALADFALGSLMHEHEKLHNAAIRYAEKLGMVWP